MQYRPYGKLGYDVSLFGMGCMRLPRIVDSEGNAEVDREKAFEMIRYAAEHGVNYFDTAFSYHATKSEEVLGEALDGGYRKNVKIATKQPFAVMNNDKGTIRKNLENTLKKLRTDKIDVYLIHNIQAKTWDDIKKLGVIEEYEKFRSEGLIGAIGFSYHGGLECFTDIFNHYDWAMCQVQQNLLDVDKETTDEAIRMAGKKGTALVIMEPLRGGGLATPSDEIKSIYKECNAERSPVEWAFRHLIDYPQISTILSGVTTLEQLKDNIEIFSKPDAVAGYLSAQEKDTIKRVKAAYESVVTVPCTGCEYCMPCPMGVDIPGTFAKFNEGSMLGNFDNPQRTYMFQRRANGGVEHCIECAACEAQCPQSIPIIKELKKAEAALAGWAE